MAVNLKKGQGINLSKEVKKLNYVTVGLGWSASTSSRTIDCDSFVYILKEVTKEEKPRILGKLFGKSEAPKTRLCLADMNDIIYYGRLRDRNECIIHHGDDLIGGAKGDCEQISIDLEHMPENIKGLVIGINIYNAYGRNQNFGKVQNCFGRIFDNATGKEICRYDLSDGNYDGYTAVIVGQFLRKDDGWHFEASGEGRKVGSIQELAGEYM